MASPQTEVKILPREWVSIQQLEGTASEKNAFNLISYNILADCHIVKNEFPIVTDEEAKMVNRHAGLIAELSESNGDIVCVQEVGADYVDFLLTPAMKELGYEATPYHQKQLGTDEGCNTYYRGEVWTLLDYKPIIFNDLVKIMIDNEKNLADEEKTQLYEHCKVDTVASMMKFEHKSTDKLLIVINVHFRFGDFMRLDLTALHASLMFREVKQYCGDENIPLVVAGDFNVMSNSATYRFLENGQLDTTDVKELVAACKHCVIDGQILELTSVFRDKFNHDFSSLKSAYKTVDVEPVVTTYTVSLSVLISECLDFIWFTSDGLRTVGILRTQPMTVLEKLVSCPNPFMPSDHFLIKARLQFL